MTSLIGYTEAALILGLKVSTLYALVHEKRVPHFRMGGRLVRFDSDELLKWVAERRVDVCGVQTAQDGAPAKGTGL